jgi:Sec-independent protein translocase protein TatA
VLGIGLKEVIVVGIVILLLFGGSILPRLARGGAKRAKESKGVFLETKQALEEGLRDLHGDDETPQPAATAQPTATGQPRPAPAQQPNKTPSR